METWIRTAVGLIVLPPALVAVSTWAILLALAGRSPERLHRIYVGFARLCLRVAGTELRVYGQHHVERGQPYVVVANHESAWDPPCIVAGLPGRVLRFVAKRSMMRIPVFGHALRLTGNVMVTRTETGTDVKRIRTGMERRSAAVSMLFFAEGTRSRDGALQPFKTGAFATALTFGLPILPVALAGTYAMWPKGRLRLRRGTVVLEVGEPIPIHGLGFEDRGKLRDQARESIVKLRARARQRLRALGQDPGGVD